MREEICRASGDQQRQDDRFHTGCQIFQIRQILSAPAEGEAAQDDGRDDSVMAGRRDDDWAMAMPKSSSVML